MINYYDTTTYLGRQISYGTPNRHIIIEKTVPSPHEIKSGNVGIITQEVYKSFKQGIRINL